MRKGPQLPILSVFFILLCHVTSAMAAVDWALVTDAEKAMKTNQLDPGAGAVVLFKRGEINIQERSSLFWVTTIQTYTRIKVLTDAGRDAANVSIEAPKWVRFSKLEGRTILPSGQVIPLDPSQVFRGRAYESGKNFAILKSTFTLPSVEAGAIIEYQTEETVDWFYPPPWIFDTQGLGTLQSSLRVVVGPRLSLAQLPIETTVSKITATQNTKVAGEQFDYSVQNLRPIRPEPFALPFRDQAAMVLFTPYELAFGNGVYPIITSWDDVAKVVSEELTNMNKSENEAKSKAKELAEKAPDDLTRAEAIYNYLQQSITSSDLVGVQLGRTADEIVTSKRGDPDEINAVFVTMLKDAKIDADLVLVAAQNYETLVTKFPSFSQFSRLITRVNLKQGPVFADPADCAAPFGELPWFEKGVTGLVVKGNKIHEAQIPAGSPEDNLSVAKLSLRVSRDWKVEGDAELNLKGAEAVDFRGELLEQPPEKVNDRLADYFSFGQADASVSDLTHPELRDTSQPFIIKARLQHRLAQEAGPGELLLNPWIADAYGTPVFKSVERRSAVRFDYPAKRVSTSTWTLPLDIKVEQLPKQVQLDNDIGTFTHSCSQSADTLTCTRTFILKKMNVQDTAEYLKTKQFFEEIAKDDQEVVVLRGQ